MAIVDGSLQLGYKNTAWFTANASLVLLVGQIVYLEQTGTYKIGDGTTQLSALSFLGGSQGVQSVTGPNIDNTDPTNPVSNTPNLDQVLAADTNANNLLEIAALNRAATSSGYNATFFINFFNGAGGTLLKISINSFIAGIRTNLDLVYTTTSAVATQITTALSGYLTAATAASIYQKLREVISSNKTAVLDEFYTVNSTCTFTDPTPSEGKGYTVFVINGTVTVGGVAYSTAGTKIERVYYSGAWANYVYGKLEKELLCSFNSTNLADLVDYRFGNTYLPATLSAGVSREFPFMLNGKIKEIVFTGLSSAPTSSMDCVLKITNKTTGVTTTVGNIRFDNITVKVSFTGLNILGSKGDACEVVFTTPAFTTNGTGSQGSALLFFEGI